MGCCTRAKLTTDGLGAQVYEAADAGEITEEEALFIVRSFLSAGLDTTVDLIGNALNCFAQYPDEWEKLRRDPDRIRAATREKAQQFWKDNEFRILEDLAMHVDNCIFTSAPRLFSQEPL